MEQHHVLDEQGKERGIDEGAFDFDDERLAFELVDVSECLPDYIDLFLEECGVHGLPRIQNTITFVVTTKYSAEGRGRNFK